MHDLLSEPTRSWFAVKAAIALSLIFTFLIVDVMAGSCVARFGGAWR
jgi:hypothetical protein